ncbi:MAG: hypothetical protein HW383_237 [Candidatus Magasanikbacteria bacterium]|nr:hypothetical protein [Candidatus Magasanikbacteria bacterium]
MYRLIITGFCFGGLVASACTRMVPKDNEAAGVFNSSEPDSANPYAVIWSENDSAPSTVSGGVRIVRANPSSNDDLTLPPTPASADEDPDACAPWRVMDSVTLVTGILDAHDFLIIPREADDPRYVITLQAWAADGDSEFTPESIEWFVGDPKMISWVSADYSWGWEKKPGNEKYHHVSAILPTIHSDLFSYPNYEPAEGPSPTDGLYLGEPTTTITACATQKCGNCPADFCRTVICSDLLTVVGAINMEGVWDISGAAISEPFTASALQESRALEWDPPYTTFFVAGDHLTGTSETLYFDAMIFSDRSGFAGAVWEVAPGNKTAKYFGDWRGVRVKGP